MPVIWTRTRPERDARRDGRWWVSALLREREGYVAKGLTDRVRQVDEQLAHYGYEGGPSE